MPRLHIAAKTIRLGIVDTGVDISQHDHALLVGGVGVIKQNQEQLALVFDTTDHHGHGTSIASLLAVFCPDATLVPVRIAQVCDGQSTSYVSEKVLALGIDWCIDNQIRLVNVSYSIESISSDGPLATICRKASENNIILVAAYRNGFQKPVYPAAFPSVIGVSIRQDLDHAQIVIISEKNRDVAAFGGPYQISSVGNKPKIVCGTSFATAQITGMIARMLAIKPSLTLKQVFGYLKKYAIE